MSVCLNNSNNNTTIIIPSSSVAIIFRGALPSIYMVGLLMVRKLFCVNSFEKIKRGTVGDF